MEELADGAFLASFTGHVGHMGLRPFLFQCHRSWGLIAQGEFAGGLIDRRQGLLVAGRFWCGALQNLHDVILGVASLPRHLVLSTDILAHDTSYAVWQECEGHLSGTAPISENALRHLGSGSPFRVEV